jgi:hypothetical protein
MIKTAQQQGYEDAIMLLEGGMEKEAIWGLLGKGLGVMGRAGSKMLGAGTKAMAANPAGMMGKAQSFMGRGMLNATGTLGNSLSALRAAPGATLRSGAANFGKGLMFGGQGVGGALGKATGAGMMFG